jgi:hypothetical protein
MNDGLQLSPGGYVIQRRFARGVAFSPKGGEIILVKPNLVVDCGLELLLRALVGIDSIRNVVFGLTGGRPITPGLRTLGAPVAKARVSQQDNTKTYISKDVKGLRTIATYTALLTPATNLQYDSLGLVSTTNLLYAAQTFAPISLAAGETIAVQWTTFLRGN